MKLRYVPRWGWISVALPAVIAGSIALSAANETRFPGNPETTIEPDEFATPLSYDRGAVGLYQSLRKLGTRASLLMITAHPDDEDGGLLTLESRGNGARVGLLCLTRGEGGANVMSDDFFDALGLVRTEELLAADRYYGVSQYWSRATDYGFSKTREEAFDEWGYDRVRSDVVRVIRMTRPLVLTSVFVGGATDGHGNHQTTGQLAQEAFRLAGDPTVYPEQLKEGLRPWNPLKVYARVPSSLKEGSLDPKGLYNYATQKWSPAGFQNYVANTWTDGGMPTTVKVESGSYDPLLGFNFLQISREGLGLQKCQNGGASVPPAGSFSSDYYRFGSRVKSGETEAGLFDGIDTTLKGISGLAGDNPPSFLLLGLEQIQELVDRALNEFSAEETGRVGPVLAEGLTATRALISSVEASDLPQPARMDVVFELRVKEKQFNEALLEALGVSALAVVSPDEPEGSPMFRRMRDTFQLAIPDLEFQVKVSVTNQTSEPVQLARVELVASDSSPWQIETSAEFPRDLAENTPQDVRFKVKVPSNPTYTRPYFTRPGIEQAYYDVKETQFLGRSHRPYPLAARLTLNYRGVKLETGQVVQTLKRVTGLGAVMNPLVVGPPVSVAVSPGRGVVPFGAESFELMVTVGSNVKGAAEGDLRLSLPQGWRAEPESARYQTARDGEEDRIAFRVFPAGVEDRAYDIRAVATYDGREYSEGLRQAGYPGLRPYNLYRPALYETRGVDVKVAKDLSVAYITGTGDSVPEYLTNLGIQVTFLSDQDLASGDLSRFDVILLGVRTYAARPALKTHNGRLLDYVKNGGVVVVQYNTPEYDENFGPYPYEMGRNPEEVTDERSPVEILKPENPALTWPNRIGADDFAGWIEQRGSKFMRSWDAHYEALVETHDPGQDPQSGGFLYAHYGRGIYVYCAYAFYRQLPEGVPGAYRLIANLLSLPRNPELVSQGAE